jgi:hypothetical protein
VAIYAGSFCQSALKAILASVGILLAVVVTIRSNVAAIGPFTDPGILVDDAPFPRQLLWGSELSLGVVALTCLMLWFAFSNYRRGALQQRETVAQAGAILLIVVLLTAGLAVAATLSCIL